MITNVRQPLEPTAYLPAPPGFMSKVKDISKCGYFAYWHKGEKNHVFCEEIFCEEDEGDIPMDEALVVTKNVDGVEHALVGVQCVFIDSATNYGFVFQSVLDGRKTFMKFKDVLRVFVIIGWITGDPRQGLPVAITV